MYFHHIPFPLPSLVPSTPDDFFPLSLQFWWEKDMFSQVEKNKKAEGYRRESLRVDSSL